LYICCAFSLARAASLSYTSAGGLSIIVVVAAACSNSAAPLCACLTCWEWWDGVEWALCSSTLCTRILYRKQFAPLNTLDYLLSTATLQCSYPPEVIVRCLDRAKGRHASPFAADAGRALTAGTGHRVGSIPSWHSPATVASKTMFLQQFRGLEQVPRRSLWYMRRRGSLLLVRILGTANGVHVHKHPSRRAAARRAPSLRGGGGLSHALEIALVSSLRQLYRLSDNSAMHSTGTMASKKLYSSGWISNSSLWLEVVGFLLQHFRFFALQLCIQSDKGQWLPLANCTSTSTMVTVP
jgi:hypothetical protein